jgi:hypothetical protein
MNPTSQIYSWTGEETFRVSGSGLHEDTLLIRSKDPKLETLFSLVLPTLCITYADMKFQNAIGGQQVNYPASQAYGPAYFNPPVLIDGEAEIERLTYIRGAEHVEIGPQFTRVQFRAWKELVIPRLRLDEKPPAEAVLSARNVPVRIDEPLTVLVMQLANGRHVGGVKLEVRHPDYKPVDEEPLYDLWVRVLDAAKLQPMMEIPVNIWHWDPTGAGAFHLDVTRYTGGDGSIYAHGRPAGELEAVSAFRRGWRVTPRCYRPLPGQPVQITLRAWSMQASEMSYLYRKDSPLEDLAVLCGMKPPDLLRLSRLRNLRSLRPGMRLRLPCYSAELYLDPGDTPQSVAECFHFADPGVLAHANGLKDLSDYDGSRPLQLPGWHFFHTGPFHRLEEFDRCFDLAPGSCVAVGQAFRPHPTGLYDGEVVGVPG